MKKESVQSIVRVSNYIDEHKATILTYMGVAGVFGTAYLAAKAKPKAEELLAEKYEYKNAYYGEELTRFEQFLAVAPAYIPTVLMGMGTIACILGANHINQEKQAMLTSAYAYLNCNYNEYRRKVKEIFGEEGERQVREAIAKDHLPQDKSEEEKLLIYDDYGKRYFRIEPTKYQDALYQLNRMYNFTGEMTLNNFYEFFDLDPIPGGDILGWSALKDYECCGISWIDVRLEKMDMIDDMDAYVMLYNVDPSDDYGCWVTRDWQ